MKWSTAAELAVLEQEEVKWVAKPWLACGCVTELDGRPKAAGKTTFIAAMVRAMLDGLLFLGERTARTPVVWLTEQSPSSFVHVLRRAGIHDRNHLFILPRSEARGHSWADVVGAAVEKAESEDAFPLIVDTAPPFMGLKAEEENSSGAVLQAMKPLHEAADRGLAVLLSRHERKGGGLVGESGRGSSAFAGAVDVIMVLRKPCAGQRRTIRHLEALSRLDDTPEKLLIELTPNGFVSLGSPADVAVQEARATLLADTPRGAAHALPLDGLAERLSLKRTTVQRLLPVLLEEGAFQRTGAGRKGSPFLYYRPEEANDASQIHSAQADRPLGRMNLDDPLMNRVHETFDAEVVS